MTGPPLTSAGAYIRRDGRTRRRQGTHDAILAACRALLQEGNLRPSMAAIAARAPCSIRTAFEHYTTVEALRTEALNDDLTQLMTRQTILGSHTSIFIDPEAWPRIVHLVVNGKVPEEG